ncbi:MAG TPA: type II toxin-antitoxin system PemK/MazF family toxin [Rhizobacter sp.]|nr:type II toxin-antitoxin system PemK/MazF family toxin [Rhizobacter sp.]
MVTRKSPLWVPERAEIIFIQYSPHVGKEMPNDHPMLVMSTKAFAEKTGIVVGFPMTHAEHHVDNPFAITAHGAKGEVGYVVVNQPKSFDWRERRARAHPWGPGHTKLLGAALKRFDSVFGVCNR